MANALTLKLDLRFEVKSKRATFQMQLNLLDYLSKSQRYCLLKRKKLYCLQKRIHWLDAYMQLACHKRKAAACKI